MKVLDILESCQSEPRETLKENTPALGKLLTDVSSIIKQKPSFFVLPKYCGTNYGQRDLYSSAFL